MNYEFNRVYRKGQRRNGEGLCLYWFKRKGRGRRVGFTVSRKLRGAVKRNRVKRVWREIYRKHEERLVDGVDLIILGRSEAVPGSFQDLEKSFLATARAASLLKDE